MLRQRVDAEQGLIPPCPFPVRQDLIVPKRSPFPDELQRPGLETPGQHISICRDGGTPACMVGVEVGNRMITLVPVHVDQHAVKRADTRHAPTITGASRHSQEESLITDRLPSSRTISARAAAIRSAGTTTGSSS